MLLISTIAVRFYVRYLALGRRVNALHKSVVRRSVFPSRHSNVHTVAGGGRRATIAVVAAHTPPPATSVYVGLNKVQRGGITQRLRATRAGVPAAVAAAASVTSYHTQVLTSLV